MDNRQTELTPHKCFRCGSEDNIIAKSTKPPKENEKQRKQVRFNERGKRVSQIKCNNGENNNDQKIYASMSQMSGNDEFPSRNFGDSLQLTNWILDSGTTCNIKPEVSDFIPGLLDDTDKHIEVADGYNVMKKKGKYE